LLPHKRLFVLDINVLVHDPSAIFRFKEHDIFIPMKVLEELDAAKNGGSELARNARQVSRTLDDLIGAGDRNAIESGLRLPSVSNSGADEATSGLLYLQTTDLAGSQLPHALPGNLPDNGILSTAHNLMDLHPDTEVTLVSKDINLRIKARIAGISAEDYYNDKTFDDVDLLYSGMRQLDESVWTAKHGEVDCISENGKSIYAVRAGLLGEIFPNECLYSAQGDIELIVRNAEREKHILEPARDYRQKKNAVWGINARNLEQNIALNMLLDPAVEFVSMIGVAGTGKTLLALAAGLVQSMENKRYREIVMTRETISVGEGIGFLPGTEEEKMTPWMGALLDNLEVLTDTTEGGEWGRAATSDLLQNRIKIRSLSFMRGRTFLNRYIIIDEAQNLTAKQLRTLITRAGPGSKIVCLGNIAQIDTPYLSETTSGLTFVVDRFRAWEHSGHITLTRGERSRLADYATANL
jgi:PhoH-like ATPase